MIPSGLGLRTTGNPLYVVGCPCNSRAPTRAANGEQQAARGTRSMVPYTRESRGDESVLAIWRAWRKLRQVGGNG